MKALSQSHNVTSASVLEVILVFLELSFNTDFKTRLSFPHFFCATLFKMIISEIGNRFYLLLYPVESVSMPISSCGHATANVGRVKLL